MNRFLFLCLLVWSGVALTLGSSQAQANPQKETQVVSHETKATIEGLVRDIARPIQNLEATATHLSMKCLRACAKNGSPLVILTKDGELYFPISASMPDTDQRQKIMPFLGKPHAIVINDIHELKDVHLTVEDQ